MTVQNYLVINESTNVVDNICLWDGDPDTWQPPANYLMLVQAITPALVWLLDTTIEDYVLTQEMGGGGIGFSWNGAECVTNEPKPPKPEDQPTTGGTQTL